MTKDPVRNAPGFCFHLTSDLGGSPASPRLHRELLVLRSPDFPITKIPILVSIRDHPR
jgi:hypothetical protein